MSVRKKNDMLRITILIILFAVIAGLPAVVQEVRDATDDNAESAMG